MNKELKELTENILKEKKSKISNAVYNLIEQKVINDVVDLKNMCEKNVSRLYREDGVGPKSVKYLKEKIHSMFTFKTETLVTYVRETKEIEIVESRGE